MKHLHSLRAALLLFLCLVGMMAFAQEYKTHGSPSDLSDPSPILIINQVELFDTLSTYEAENFFTNSSAVCATSFSYFIWPHSAVGTGGFTNTESTPTIIGGAGQHTFFMRIRGSIHSNPSLGEWYTIPGVDGTTNDDNRLGWQLFVNDTANGTVEVLQINGGSSVWDIQGPNYDKNFDNYLKITFTGSDPYGQGNGFTFALRPYVPITVSGGAIVNYPSPMEFKFGALVVGAYFDNVGELETPEAPTWILRDPPGDRSYGSWGQSTRQCVDESLSTSFDYGASGYVKARIGGAGSMGIGIEVPYEIYGEVGASFSGGRTETTNSNYRTCLTTTQAVETSHEGAPQDVFFGSSVRYYYGAANVVSRDGCGPVQDTAQFMIVPKETINRFTYSESNVRAQVLTLKNQRDQLVAGTDGWNKLNTRMDIWAQALAMNDSIKAASNYTHSESFGSGPIREGSTVASSEETHSLTYNIYLEEQLSFDFVVHVGGMGGSGGAAITFKQQFGSSSGSSSDSTNTVGYHFEDAGTTDLFVVDVGKDRVFGSAVYKLDPAQSRTSCPYEGGYQIDQPALFVGTQGNSSMTLTEVPVVPDATANFPVILCNNSNLPRTYYLKYNNVTNGGNATIKIFGNTINSNDNGAEIILPASTCVNATLTLTASSGTFDFPNINLYLYTLCDTTLRSYITISAFFGDGNVGGYCIPVSQYGPTDGDYVDGVQIGDINNTGTGGGVGDTTYTNYSGEFSTTLSRNEQSMVTITTGSYQTDWYAAWIDFNKNAEFEESELLGTFQSTGSHQSHNIEFTVPATAVLGTTTLRVRGAYLLSSDPNPIDPCFNYAYGETEDYAIVINNNTHQDCLGANNGPALPGTPCDDGNTSTVEDMFNANCECVGMLVTAVSEGDAPKLLFSVRPNPSTGIFQLNNPTDAPARVEVRDALGRVVMASTTMTERVSTFDLSDVSAGIYQLIVEQDGRRDVIKIMVRR